MTVQLPKVWLHGLPVGPLLAQPERLENSENPENPLFDQFFYRTFSLVPRTPTIGAEIVDVNLRDGVSAEMIAELRQALVRWKIIYFRDQDLSTDQFIEWGYQFGSLEEHPFTQSRDGNQTHAKIVTLAKNASQGGYENMWHNDVTWREAPAQFSILRALQVPQVGGDTLWNDMHAAYNNLSPQLKERIDDLYASHDWYDTFGRFIPEDKIAEYRAEFPVAHHPLVHVLPENKHKVVFVNQVFTNDIVGYSPNDSHELLMELYSQIYRPEYQFRLHWEPNTIAMWDNRACQHYAVSDYYPQTRIMQRLSVVGSRPGGNYSHPIS